MRWYANTQSTHVFIVNSTTSTTKSIVGAGAARNLTPTAQSVFMGVAAYYPTIDISVPADAYI